MQTQRDHANSMPRKGKGNSDGGQFVSKGGPRAQAAPAPTVNLASSQHQSVPGSAQDTVWPGGYEAAETERSRMFPNLRIGEMRHTEVNPRKRHFHREIEKIQRLVDNYYGSDEAWNDMLEDLERESTSEPPESREVNTLRDVVRRIEWWREATLEGFLDEVRQVGVVSSHRSAMEAVANADSIGDKLMIPNYTWRSSSSDSPDSDDFQSENRAAVGFTLLNVSREESERWADGAIEIEASVVEIGVPTVNEMVARWMKEEMKGWLADGRFERGGESEHSWDKEMVTRAIANDYGLDDKEWIAQIQRYAQ